MIFDAKSDTPLIAGLHEIADAYDGFVFDVWGTVYDGTKVFPDVIEALTALRKRGKPVAFLSNSPQLPSVVATRLVGIGIEPACHDGIVTSGGETHHQLSEGKEPKIADFKGPVYLTGPDRFPDTLPRDQFPEAGSIEDADWILNAGPNLPPDTVADYDERLHAAAGRGLPMLCANPDREVLHGTDRQICAGALAERYSELGGQVHAIGKPFGAVFDRCRELLDLTSGDRILMVGDNLETDILGANRAGFGALLIASGVHALSSPDQPIDLDRLSTLQQQLSARADHVLARLHW